MADLLDLSDNIDPKRKGKDWIRDRIKKHFEESGGGKMFYHNRTEYNRIKSYAMGRQSDGIYKTQLKTDQDIDSSWMNINYGIVGIVPKFRRVALGKLTKSDYNINATPIDAASKTEQDKYYAGLKSKLMMKQMLAQAVPELAQAPALQINQKDPQDLEELEMQNEFGFKNEKAIEAEEGIKLIFYQNDIDSQRKLVFEDLFDYGVSGYKDWIDSNGYVRFRRVDPRNIVTSNTSNFKFKDIRFAGEIVEMSISELKEAAGDEFTKDEYEQITNDAFAGIMGATRDKQKFRVLDMEFFSYDTKVRRKSQTPEGNIVFKEAKYDNLKSGEKSVINGKEEAKYISTNPQVVYKGKWIMDTNFIFDYGLATDMKREKSSMENTALSFMFIAPDFHDMTALGIMEQLIPIADQIQIAWYRLQNSMNKAIPKGMKIDIGALEKVSVGQGGLNMTPIQLYDFFQKTGILVVRRDAAYDNNPNYTEAEVLENGMGNDVAEYWNIIQNNVELIRQITGLNEFTDGSSPNPRANKLIGQSAIESTNNSLEYIIGGERMLLEGLAKSVILRLQDSVLKGNVSGYVKSLGTGTIKLIQVGKGISEAEFGIMLEDEPNDNDKLLLQEQIMIAQKEGILDPVDAMIIQMSWNLKYAQQLLSYKIKRRREEMQAQAQQNLQTTTDGQIQSAQAAEQSKQATLQMQHEFKMKEIEATKTWEYKIKELDVSGRADSDVSRMTEKLITKSMDIAKDMQGEEGVPGYESLEEAPEEMPEMQEEIPQEMEQPVQ